jgi:hypothetical protein
MEDGSNDKDTKDAKKDTKRECGHNGGGVTASHRGEETPMPLHDVLPALRRLDRADKLRAMQFLIGELSREEGILLEAGAEYPVWSPYEAFEAAEVLRQVLQTAETTDDARR